MHAFAIGMTGLLGLSLASYALARALRTGAARLRGGRQITKGAHPALFWVNIAASCTLLAVSLGLLIAGGVAL